MNAVSFTHADYGFMALAIILVVMGLFRGASGFFAFVSALAGAAAAAMCLWPYTASFSQELWVRSAIELVSVLLVYGVLRMIIKKVVNGLLSQPSDSIFGVLIALLFSALIVFFASKIDLVKEHSNIAVVASELFKGDADDR